MGKYTSDAKELLHLVGGRENIAAVSHCITRMRFVLNDPKKADIQKIEAMKAVKGSFTQAGQFQVIIGNTVSDFYNDFIAVAGIEGVSKDAVKSAAKQNQNVVQRIMTALAEIFAPLIPAIIVGGLILGFRNCIDSLYLSGIQYWGRRNTVLLVFGLVVCCFAATRDGLDKTIQHAIAAPIARTQKVREAWFYVMSSGAVLKIATMELARMMFR